jgi:hypothetical protein
MISVIGWSVKKCIHCGHRIWISATVICSACTLMVVQIKIYLHFQPWGWWQHSPPKRWYPTTTLHGVTVVKITSCIFTPQWQLRLSTFRMFLFCFVKVTESEFIHVEQKALRRCEMYEGVSRSFGTESITKYTLTTINTRWEATQRVMAAKLTRLTHKIAIQLHLVAESCTICSSRSRRPVRKLLDTLSCFDVGECRFQKLPQYDAV